MYNEVMTNIDHYEPSDIMQTHAEIVEREREEKERKLREQWKKLDYMTRALRAEEIDLITVAEKQQKVEDAKLAQELYDKRLTEHKQFHARALVDKARLSRMRTYKSEFHDKLMEKRKKYI